MTISQPFVTYPTDLGDKVVSHNGLSVKAVNGEIFKFFCDVITSVLPKCIGEKTLPSNRSFRPVSNVEPSYAKLKSRIDYMRSATFESIRYGRFN